MYCFSSRTIHYTHTEPQLRPSRLHPQASSFQLMKHTFIHRNSLYALRLTVSVFTHTHIRKASDTDADIGMQVALNHRRSPQSSLTTIRFVALDWICCFYALYLQHHQVPPAPSSTHSNPTTRISF